MNITWSCALPLSLSDVAIIAVTVTPVWFETWKSLETPLRNWGERTMWSVLTRTRSNGELSCSCVVEAIPLPARTIVTDYLLDHLSHYEHQVAKHTDRFS